MGHTSLADGTRVVGVAHAVGHGVACAVTLGDEE